VDPEPFAARNHRVVGRLNAAMINPTRNVAKVLLHLGNAEKELDSAIAAFTEVRAEENKEATRQLRRLVEVVQLLQEFQVDVPAGLETRAGKRARRSIRLTSRRSR
jgi:hypothetical protein